MKALKQKRHALVASSILSLSLAAGALSVPQIANAADFDWKQAGGTSLSISFNQHPYADAIIQRLPQFKELTGVDVKYELTPEENYFDKVTTQLSAATGVPGCFHDGRLPNVGLCERQTHRASG